MNAVAPYAGSRPPALPSPGAALIPTDMGQAMKLAQLMSRSKLVPVHLQGSDGDCFLVVEQAMRWGMSPFAVAQCTSSIKGKLMFEGKLVHAAVENSGVLSGLFDFAFEGEGAGRRIVVSATRRGEKTPRAIEVALADAATDNIHWKRQPDQQLVYHGVRVWARRWTPAVMLGVYVPEEFYEGDEPRPVVSRDPAEDAVPQHAGPTIDHEAASAVREAAPVAAEAARSAERAAEDAPPADPHERFAGRLVARFAQADSLEAFGEIVGNAELRAWIDRVEFSHPDLHARVIDQRDRAALRLKPPYDDEGDE